MSFFPTYLLKAIDKDFIAYIDSRDFGMVGCGHIENTKRLLATLAATDFAGMKLSWDDDWNSLDSDDRNSYKTENTVDPEERKRIYTEFRNGAFLLFNKNPESKLWNKVDIYKFF
jgi:hypothetical protein